MAASFCIHIFEGITEEDLADFFCSNLGSKYFDLRRASAQQRPGAIMLMDRPSHKKIRDSASVTVGDVSWLKAAVLGDREEFIPGPIEKLSELVGEELPVIDEAFIAAAKEAYKLPNDSGYDLEGADKVIGFLRQHQGKRVFSVSW